MTLHRLGRICKLGVILTEALVVWMILSPPSEVTSCSILSPNGSIPGLGLVFRRDGDSASQGPCCIEIEGVADDASVGITQLRVFPRDMTYRVLDSRLADIGGGRRPLTTDSIREWLSKLTPGFYRDSQQGVVEDLWAIIQRAKLNGDVKTQIEAIRWGTIYLIEPLSPLIIPDLVLVTTLNLLTWLIIYQIARRIVFPINASPE